MARQSMVTRWHQSAFIKQLEQQPAHWMLVIGMLLGAGLSAVALFGIGGVMGVLPCLAVLGVAVWLGAGAQPILQETVRPVESQKTAIRLEMVELPGGTFLMGSPADDKQPYKDEKPQHPVTVSSFAIGRYPVTRELYRAVMSEVPSQWAKSRDDNRLPANYVNWFDAINFCNILSERQGLQPCYRVKGKQVDWDRKADGYRLPTEAEWEYAMRAGTTTRWFCGDEPTELKRYAWFDESVFTGSVYPVGGKEPNPWGFYDLAGNVWEWCWDWYGGYKAEAVTDPVGPSGSWGAELRVLRGGAYWDEARSLRSADRDWDQPTVRRDEWGFRCVRASRRQHG